MTQHKHTIHMVFYSDSLSVFNIVYTVHYTLLSIHLGAGVPKENKFPESFFM